MFEIGWTEMLVIAVVMIVVVGPKDLPKMLRTIGKMTAKVRGMAGDFQKQFNDALKEAELDDVKKSVDSLRSLNPASEIKKQLNPFEKAAADVRAGLDSAMKPKPSTSSEPASPVAHEAEPLKNGAISANGSGNPTIGAIPMPDPKPVAAPATPAPIVAPVEPAAAPAAPAAVAAMPAVSAPVKPKRAAKAAGAANAESAPRASAAKPRKTAAKAADPATEAPARVRKTGPKPAGKAT